MKGVYKITNTVNGKVYIGSTTTDFDGRWATHRAALRSGRHFNYHLQQSWNKYGESAFVFEVIETGEAKDEIREKELSWIQRFFGKNCYNATTKAAGRPATKEKKPKRSNAERLAVLFKRHEQKRLENQKLRENWIDGRGTQETKDKIIATKRAKLIARRDERIRAISYEPLEKGK